MNRVFVMLTRLSVAATIVLGVAYAHQPKFPDEGVTVVTDPDVSQAFYGEFAGEPALYRIEVPDSLLLYVAVLVPNMPMVAKDVSAEVFVETDSVPETVAVLDAAASTWQPFHEPFANDDYFQGPEARTRVGPGDYMVRVTRPGNQGKYVLAIGERESFPPRVIARVIGDMPRLKRYFGKSPWTAYFNRSGLFLGTVAVAVAGVVTLVVLLAGR